MGEGPGRVERVGGSGAVAGEVGFELEHVQRNQPSLQLCLMLQTHGSQTTDLLVDLTLFNYVRLATVEL